MCERCDDTYIITTTDWVPYGSTNVPMDSSEVCDCLEVNGCPKCGGDVEFKDNYGCDVYCTDEECGWEMSL